MNNYKLFRFLELFWLCIAILAAAAGAWMFHNHGVNEAKFPFFVAFVAAVLFGLRRYQRKKTFPGQNNNSAKK